MEWLMNKPVHEIIHDPEARLGDLLSPQVVKITQTITNLRSNEAVEVNQGSGFFISKDHVLTCKHWVRKLEDYEQGTIDVHQCTRKSFRHISSAEVVCRFEDENVAVLRLGNYPLDESVAKLGGYLPKEVADIVLIGYPSDETVVNVNFGKVSALGLDHCIEGPNKTELRKIRHKMTADTCIGKTGGPVYLVQNQEVIGLHSDILYMKVTQPDETELWHQEPGGGLFISMKGILPVLVEKGYVSLNKVPEGRRFIQQWWI